MKRRRPKRSIFNTTTIIPTSIYSLEKDEIYPYERFTYNILHVGAEVLHKRELPGNILVCFQIPQIGNAWSFNSGITSLSGNNEEVDSYKIIIPELFPSLLYIYCFRVANKFGEDNTTGLDLLEALIQYVHIGNKMVSSYKVDGLAHAIRCGYEFCELSIWDLEDISEIYNLLSKQIAYHEIAHAYSIKKINRNMSPAEKCGFEYVADILSIFWFYTEMIANTPNTKEYREFRKKDSYSECITQNAKLSLNSIMNTLLLFGISRAQIEKGIVKYDGTVTHPNSLLRYIVQSTVFLTLLESNYRDILCVEQFDEIETMHNFGQEIILGSGLIDSSAVMELFNRCERENLEKAADLIESEKIHELDDVKLFIRNNILDKIT